MTNKYVYDETILTTGVASSSSIISNFQAVQTAFALLPNPKATGGGFDEPLIVAPATDDDHAATLAQLITAVAESNYAGAWSSLTGSMSEGASVLHSNTLWLALSDIPDVTTEEPGVSAEWQELPLLKTLVAAHAAETADVHGIPTGESVIHSGVVGTGSTDVPRNSDLPFIYVDGPSDAATNTAAINDAITAANAAGGGVVIVPKGTWLHSGVTVLSNVVLTGEGPATILSYADNSDSTCVNANGASNFAVCNLKIYGNRDGQVVQGGHGIRLESCSNVRLYQLWIDNAPNYGIGAQAGTIADVHIDRCRITDSGADGIDFKNTNDNNNEIRITNVSVIGFDGKAGGSKAGIDIRGPAVIQNVYVENGNPMASSACIRFREGVTTDPGGVGGNFSVLTGFRTVTGAGAVASFGVRIAADDAQVADGNIAGTADSWGIQAVGKRGSIDSVAIYDAAKGVRVNYTSAIMTAEDIRISRLMCVNIAGRGVEVNSDSGVVDNCAITNSTFINCGETAIRLLAGTTNAYIGAGNVFRGNAVDITDAGTDTRIGGNGIGGGAVEANLIASGLAADSTGTRTFSVAHGLDFTPNPEDVSISIIRETVVADTRIEHIQIDTTTATDITGRAIVVTASATGGATFGVGIRIRVKA